MLTNNITITPPIFRGQAITATFVGVQLGLFEVNGTQRSDIKFELSETDLDKIESENRVNTVSETCRFNAYVSCMCLLQRTRASNV